MNEKDTYDLIDNLIKDSNIDEIDFDINEEVLNDLTIDNKLDSLSKDRIKASLKSKIGDLSINKKQNNKFKKSVIIASLISVIVISPIAVKAIADKIYNYIDTTGQVITSKESLYKLKKTIAKEIGKNIVTLESFIINTESNQVNLKIRGEGSFPNIDKLTVKIGDEYLEPSETGYGGNNKEWISDNDFKYKGKYKLEDNIEIYFELEDGSKVIFNPVLERSGAVSTYGDLGPGDEINGVEIISSIKYDGDTLDVNFISSLENNNLKVSNYGNPYSYDEKTKERSYGIMLVDKNGMKVQGKRGVYSDRSNNFTFDISGLEKPFKIIIPQLVVEPQGKISNSGKIKIPIPKEDEVINFNKEIKMKRHMYYGVLNDNDVFKISKIKRNNDNKVRLYIEYPKNNTTAKRRMIEIKATYNKFDNGSNGWAMLADENSIGFRMDLEPMDINKKYMKIDFIDSEFIVYGPWEIAIE